MDPGPWLPGTPGRRCRTPGRCSLRTASPAGDCLTHQLLGPGPPGTCPHTEGPPCALAARPGRPPSPGVVLSALLTCWPAVVALSQLSVPPLRGPLGPDGPRGRTSEDTDATASSVRGPKTAGQDTRRGSTRPLGQAGGGGEWGLGCGQEGRSSSEHRLRGGRRRSPCMGTARCCPGASSAVTLRCCRHTAGERRVWPGVSGQGGADVGSPNVRGAQEEKGPGGQPGGGAAGPDGAWSSRPPHAETFAPFSHGRRPGCVLAGPASSELCFSGSGRELLPS